MISLPGPDQPDRRSRHKIKEIVVGLQGLTPKAFPRMKNAFTFKLNFRIMSYEDVTPIPMTFNQMNQINQM